MLPSTGWLADSPNTPPEHWPLPEKYVGVYVDPDYSYDNQHFETFRKQPPDKVSDTGVTQSVLLLGDASLSSLVGRSFITDIDGVKITLTQTGVFAVILLDSITLPVIPKCFFLEPAASEAVQIPEVAAVVSRVEEAPLSFTLVEELANVAVLTSEDGINLSETVEVAETCEGCNA